MSLPVRVGRRSGKGKRCVRRRRTSSRKAVLASPRHGRGQATRAPRSTGRSVGSPACDRRAARLRRVRRRGVAGRRARRRSAPPRSSPPPLRSRRARSGAPAPAPRRPGVAVVVGATALAAWAGSRSRGRSPATGRGSGSPAGSSTWRSSRSASRRGRSRPAHGGSRRSSRVVVAAALAWALLGVAVPSLFEDGDRIARLREPVGYWNALALLADGGLALGLWLGPHAAARAPRLRAPPRLRGDHRAAAHPVACGHRRRGRGPRALAGAVRPIASQTRCRPSSPCSPESPSPAGPSRAPRSSRTARSVPTASRTGGRSPCSPSPAALVVALAAWRLPVSRLVVERAAPRARRARRRVRGLLVVGVAGVAAAVGNPRLVGVVAALGRGVRERPRAAHGSLRQQPPGLVEGVASARRGQARSPGSGARHVRDRPEARPRGRELGRASRTASRSSCSPTSAPSASASALLVIGGAIVGVRRGSAVAPTSGERPAAVALALPRPRLRRPRARRLRPRLPRGHRADARRARRPAGARPPAARPCGSAGRARRCCSRPPSPRSSSSSLPALAEREVERSLDAVDAGRRRGRRRRADRARQLNPSRSARSRRSPSPRTRPGTSGWPSRGTSGRPSSSPRTRTRGTRSASTTSSRRATGAPRTRR